jgi:hypothetical protein
VRIARLAASWRGRQALLRAGFTVTINRMDDVTPNKGGRPPKPEDERLTANVMLRLTTAMHAKLLRLGGVEWLRERIKRAKEPDKTE